MKTAVKLLLMAVVLTLLTSTALAVSDWTYVYDGVWYATGTKTSPRTMKAYALRVDLRNPSIGITATPSNGSAPYETNLQTTPSFRSMYNLEAAVNANFYSASGSYANVRGCLIWAGQVVSGHEAAFPAQLRVTADKFATILNAGGTPTGQHTVVSGDAWHLTNGGAFGANDVADPRTSVGISKDGRFLIMCVVDGRGAGGSYGATILDMSRWMLDFGAWNAMNLDGGGSSTICTGKGGVLNNPSDGSPRAVGANLGVNAASRDPRQNVFWINTGTVYTNRWLTSTGSWGNNTSLGSPTGGATGKPSGVSRKPGSNWVFVKGTNYNIYYKTYEKEVGSWGDWGNLGGENIVQSSPDACSWNYDRVDVFARSKDDTLLQKTWTVDNGWSSWIDRGGTITSMPSACSWGPGRIDVFARGANNDLVHKWYNGSWSSWESLGGTLSGGPDAVCRETNKIMVFWPGSDNKLKKKSWSGSYWTSVQDLGGTVYGHNPGAVSRSPSIVTVFVHGPGDTIWSRKWQDGGSWTPWLDQGWSVQGGVDACSWTNDAGTHQ